MSNQTRPAHVKRHPRKRRRTMFVFRDSRRYRISFNIFVTLALIFLGGLGTAVSYAYIGDTQKAIHQTRIDIQTQKDANAALRAELTQKYTLDEVERVATDRLDMHKPDASQTIRINVPKQSFVVLNDTAEESAPVSLWQAIWSSVTLWFKPQE